MPDPPISQIRVSLEQFTDLLDRCQWPLYTFLRGIMGDVGDSMLLLIMLNSYVP